MIASNENENDLIQPDDNISFILQPNDNINGVILADSISNIIPAQS